MHEHWNDPTNKQYSRNLGTGQGIELVALTASRPNAILAISQAGTGAIVSWQGSLSGYRLQSATSLAQPVSWSDVGISSTLVLGRNTITNNVSATNLFYRLIK